MAMKKWDIKKIYSDSVFAFGAHQNFLIGFVRGKMEIEHAKLFNKHMGHFCDNHSNPGYFGVVSQSAGVPSSQARKVISEGMKSFDFVATTVVIEAAKGFWGAAALGFMSALQVSARQSYPNKNFGDFNEATNWFARTTREKGNWTLSQADIESIVKEFIAQF